MTTQEDIAMITLISSDNASFELPLAAAELAAMVLEYGFDQDDVEASNVMNIPRASSEVLTEIVDFLKHHQEDPMKEIPIPLGADTFEGVISQDWYIEFSRKMTREDTLFKVLAAANYMSIRPLLDLCCLEITFNLSNKDAEGIREYLRLPELTAEEEADARERHPWIFEHNN